MARIFVLLSLFAFGLGACGSDDDSGGGTGSVSNAAVCQHMLDICGDLLPFTQEECVNEAAADPPTDSERQCIVDATVCEDVPACDPNDCACDVDFECSATCDCDPECGSGADAGADAAL